MNVKGRADGLGKLADNHDRYSSPREAPFARASTQIADAHKEIFPDRIEVTCEKMQAYGQLAGSKHLRGCLVLAGAHEHIAQAVLGRLVLPRRLHVTHALLYRICQPQVGLHTPRRQDLHHTPKHAAPAAELNDARRNQA